MISFTVRMEERVHKALKSLAKKERRSINEQISWMIEHRNDKVIEAIGWAHADCCADLDAHTDPRKTNMTNVLERAKKDLNL
jgi:hypothetical protein